MTTEPKVRALAARQPVGQEPVAILYVAEREGCRKANVLANVADLPEGKYKLYAAPPALRQAHANNTVRHNA